MHFSDQSPDRSMAKSRIIRDRHTKIIATLGPASQSADMIAGLFRAGADVFRLNMSHGSRTDKAELITTIRQVEKDMNRPIAIMADLQGPKLRIGQFRKGKIDLEEGTTFTLDRKDAPGTQNRVNLDHPEIYSSISTGQHILIDDGRIRLEVTKAGKDAVTTRVLVGGELSNRKGVNLPDVILPVSALTDKDRKDLEFALEKGVDWVALSFVQRADDVAEVKKIVAGRAAVMAKLEKPAAIEALPDILDVADGVMVARGDLGVEAPVELVPSLQKRIVRRARALGRPVVVATQMLESMIHSPVPTRAEVSDIANAVYEGADAVMLSAESAAGDYPLEAVTVMDRVIQQAEQDTPPRPPEVTEPSDASSSAEKAITAAARHVATTVRAAAIVTFTTSGSTAIRAARERPGSVILTLTPNIAVARKLALVWGLHTVKTMDATSFEEMIGKARRMALREGLATGGQRIVITAGVPFGTPGATNVLHIAWVSGDELRKHEGNKKTGSS